MIPKKIHYCWFGNKPLPASAKRCIESWKIFLPDYEIIEWNEKNYDVNFNTYTKQAYEEKKYAFVTDVARLDIIYRYGGIYFDVDVEVVKGYTDVIKNKAFFGLESNGKVATGLGFGAEKNNSFVKELLDDYNDRKFINTDKTLNLVPCPIINSKIFNNYNFKLDNKIETINGITVYPSDYFNPLEVGTGTLKKTKNTHSIHWFAKTWVPKNKIIISKLTKPFHKLFGINCFNWLKRRDR